MPSSTRRGHALAAQLAVVRDGEAVRLVADPLQQVQRLAVAGDRGRGSLRPGTYTSSKRLASDATGISSSSPSSSSTRTADAELALAAVDQQQLRRVGELAGAPRSPTGRSRSSR